MLELVKAAQAAKTGDSIATNVLTHIILNSNLVDGDYVCNQSYNKIAAGCSITKQTAIKKIRLLENAGFISAQRCESRGGNGSRSTNTYVVNKKLLFAQL